MAVMFSYDCDCDGPCTHVRFEGTLYDDWREIVEDLVTERQYLLDSIGELRVQLADARWRYSESED